MMISYCFIQTVLAIYVQSIPRTSFNMSFEIMSARVIVTIFGLNTLLSINCQSFFSVLNFHSELVAPLNGNISTMYYVGVSFTYCKTMFEETNNSYNVMNYKRLYTLCEIHGNTGANGETTLDSDALGSVTIFKYRTESGNLALDKHAKQSSQSAQDSASVAGLAVDGDKTTDYHKKINDSVWIFHCSHTAKNTTGQWWMVDLEDMFQVSDIVVWGRVDCCWDDKIKGLMAAVGVGVTGMQPCGEQFQGPSSENPFNFTCTPSLIGRFVKIYRDDSMPISLCEVEIYS
ncbi:FUCL1-like protein [Mya arenaria]|uniref:FUCL1-like protein n=2 Tax=Mya arenaria TaxID=6604 RepID=A0ABY7DA35_MYAAR|nr:FUCL1-like protein [Mya arenaria]